MSSLIELHNYQLTIPNYTTLCRRKRTLDVSKKLKKWNRKENIVFAVNVSGLKCSSEKEWTQSQYRRIRRRKFSRIHAGINMNTRHILFNKSTTSRVSDIPVLPKAIKNIAIKQIRYLQMVVMTQGLLTSCPILRPKLLFLLNEMLQPTTTLNK